MKIQLIGRKQYISEVGIRRSVEANVLLQEVESLVDKKNFPAADVPVEQHEFPVGVNSEVEQRGTY